MKYNILGKTGIEVSELCLGTMSFGGQADEKESAKIYKLCIDSGINFFDCANVYEKGRSEIILGKLIQGNRNDLVITSKAYFPTSNDVNARGGTRKHIMTAINESLKRLNTDYIDIYFLHRFDDLTPIEETLRVLEDLVTSGKVLYLGASNFAAWVFAHGGDVFDYNTGQYIFNGPAAIKAMEFIQGMSSKGCAIVARGKYTDQQYLGQGSVLFAAGSTSGITYFQKAIEEGYNGNWDIAPISYTTSEPVLNLYGGGLIMGNSGDVNRMVAAYQWMKYISNTENSAVWSTESGYGFVRSSSADHPLIAEKRAELAQYDKSLGMVKYGIGEPSVPGYYSVRGEVEKAYAAIINGDDILSTLNQLNEDANEILADAIAE